MMALEGAREGRSDLMLFQLCLSCCVCLETDFVTFVSFIPVL